jgi:membrane protease YdiL (CAAX protease family)
MKNNKVIILGLLTLLFFGIGGILIIELYNERSFLEELVRGWDISLQVIIGILYGLTSSLICIMIINREFFKAEKQYYQKKIANFEINNFNIILISLCAGIGEEIFFRAALQPILGIWTTAIIFVMLHGYINPFNWRISIYGFLMIFVMSGIGYLYDKVGLISVMVAHSVIDIVLFKLLLKGIKNEIEV